MFTAHMLACNGFVIMHNYTHMQLCIATYMCTHTLTHLICGPYNVHIVSFIVICIRMYLVATFEITANV